MALGSTYNVHHKIVNGYINYYVKIYSSQLIADLNRHTSYNEEGLPIWNSKLDRKLYSHYIRGYFDGKGYWGIYPDRKIFVFSIRSNSLRLITKVKKILQLQCKLNNVKIVFRKKCYSIQYSGLVQCRSIYEYLYKDADIYSLRKHESVAAILSENTL
jgi:hypothetical protein